MSLKNSDYVSVNYETRDVWKGEMNKEVLRPMLLPHQFL